MINLYKPISTINHSMQNKAEPEFVEEKFVRISDSDKFVIGMQYYSLGIPNAIKECYVRYTVYQMLKKASVLLPDGYKFKIYDAWRPFDVQKFLYKKYSTTIKNTYKHLEERELQKIINSFVSPPIENCLTPPVHCTGGAVDLTILDINGKALDMGCEFDSFSKFTNTDAFENSDNNITARQNRRLLYNIMTTVGFTNLSTEWWHFDYGDAFWSNISGSPIIYKGIFNENEIIL